MKNHLTKHQVLIRFINTADKNCDSHFYNDSYFSKIPRPLLYDYINELVSEGYIQKRVRHVHLTSKAYSYKHERRAKLWDKILSVLGKPISYVITWILSMLSTLIVQYLIHILGLNS